MRSDDNYLARRPENKLLVTQAPIYYCIVCILYTVYFQMKCFTMYLDLYYLYSTPTLYELLMYAVMLQVVFKAFVAEQCHHPHWRRGSLGNLESSITLILKKTSSKKRTIKRAGTYPGNVEMNNNLQNISGITY